MAAASTNSSNDFVNRLTHSIDSLQTNFRKLSKNATIKELGTHFSTAVKEMFTAASVDILFRQNGSPAWERLINDGISHPESSFAFYNQATAAASQIHAQSGTLAIVQRLTDKSLLGIVVSLPSPGSYTELDIVSLRLLSHVFENAYQELFYKRAEKDMVFSLNHRILQLNSLIDTGIEVATLDMQSAPHKLALTRAASLTNAARGTVKVITQDTVKEEYYFPEGEKITHTPSGNNTITSTFSFLNETYTFLLLDKESRAGIVPFEETDQLLLDALTRQVHASLENRYLHQQALENQRIEQEMNVAASIQQRIIPASLPAINGYEIAGKNIPSKSIGGDYYDCVPLSDGKYALIIADVSGKGIPAALLVSSLHAYLSAYLESTDSLSLLISRLNRVLYRASTADKFVTAFIALLTPATGELECVNAGHNPGYILRNDLTIEELKAGGLPLGSFDLDIPYDNQTITLQKGDRLLLYTDGVTEAEDEQHELYENRSPLPDFLRNNPTAQPQKFISDLIVDIKKFSGSAPQSDDITILYLHRIH
jgi:serine phosphatase RsbU (regulator of sigma subunit)